MEIYFITLRPIYSKLYISQNTVFGSFENSQIQSLKRLGEALNCGNYRGLKLTDQVTKVLEHVLDSAIHQMVDIDKIQFGFVPARGTTNVIFTIRQLHEKYRAVKNPLYFFAL